MQTVKDSKVMKNDISNILKKEFYKRKQKNPKYSLRAFSRDLKMSPGFLSEIMQHKKKISVDKAMQISQLLGWTWRESQIFLQTAQLGYAKTKHAKTFLQQEISKSAESYAQFETIKLSRFSPISNWYHMAIIELPELDSFQNCPKWISTQLGIDESLAKDALIRLKQDQLIIQNEQGRWIKNINFSLADVKSADVRKFHKQHLTNAAVALENQEFKKRHFSGITMAIDSHKLPEAIELIKEFRSRMSLLLESGTKDSVYHLAIQLFQLDQKYTP